jgi:chromosome segregation protein
MLIQRVAIQGFKTFAKRTEFLFAPGITAIVGPNGSGKSNVVDAIRWCLGEQSFSLLRSKKTSDIIFAGSDKRARLGMAEVSLTLDNRANEIPVDFSEVEITRRAYRDGENEYLLNGQQVRLQDVTDLLAQTGLGKRTYALIGQGLIDQVLSYSPEERRVLFEEAAGITGYQTKRAATLRRLEATQQNLTRVQDIIAELSPRLKYLRRQAERAREYEAIASDLRNLLRDWYGYRWHTTLHTIAQTHAAEQELRGQVTARQDALATLNARIETVRTRLTHVRSELGELHRASSTVHSQAETTERELAVVGERQRQLQARSEETERELATLRLEQATLTERIAATRAAVTAAQHEQRARQTLVDTALAGVTQRQAEQTERQRVLDQARQALAQVQSRHVECRSRLAQSRERQTTLLQEQTQQQQTQAAASQEKQTLTERLHAAEAQSSRDEQHAQTRQEQVATWESQMVTLRGQLRTAEEGRQQADRALDRLQTRADLLRRLSEEGAGYASGVRAVLQASRAGGPLTGVLGTVASLVRVPSHLDKAIETALGGAFQDVVTAEWEAARQAIEYLKRGNYGRATFLPLDRLHVSPPIRAPRQPGILGTAADLVEYDSRIGEVVQQLLGRVWVAEDLPAARTALDRAGGNLRPTVVTLTGEIIRPGGAVSGGSDHTRRDESVLARERELRALPPQIEAARRTVQTAATQCADLAKASEALQVQIEAEKQTLVDLARRERAHRQGIDELRRQVDRAQQNARWQQERLAQTARELETLTIQSAQWQHELQQLQAAEESATATVATAEAAVRAGSADELLQALADVRAAAAEASGHLRSQQLLLENQLRNEQSVTAQLQTKEERLAALSEEATGLATQIEHLQARDGALRGQIEHLRRQSTPLEAQAAQLAEEQAHKESREREVQQALRRDESNWHNAQLHVQRAQDQLQQLRHEIEQDLGLVTLEESDAVAYQPPLPLDKYVEQLPVRTAIPETLEEEVRDTRAHLARASNVNPDAPREYDEAASRYDFLLTQSTDLEAAAADLRKVVKELDLLMEVAFERTFRAVAEQFVYFFQQLFTGGTAELVLTAPADMTSTGVEIIARPPGKRPQSLALLSGGERSLVACALIFAILRVSPTPFCVLDEVDAALDEANVDRFRQTVEELSQETQFILVTHNRRTLEGASAIYGVTMGNDGVSTVISLRLEGEQIVHHTNGTPEKASSAAVTVIEELVKM